MSWTEPDDPATPIELVDPLFPDAETWVQRWLLPVWMRSPDSPTVVWCARWWAHPEALSRLDALWRAWEHLRLDPAVGMSSWWRDHADHHLPVLTRPDGPFAHCNPNRHTPGTPLPTQPPPTHGAQQ